MAPPPTWPISATLELANINPSQFVANALRALKPGGVGIFVMAAHQWLLSEHDRAVNSVRRYNLPQLTELFNQPGVEIIRASYLFFLLFPLMVERKLTNRSRPAQEAIPARSDVGLMPAVINEPLYWLCWLEAAVSLPTCSPRIQTSPSAWPRTSTSTIFTKPP
ncbi:MAG: hypothetical protein WD751_08725 [Anaerolineales bacterium]